MRVNLEKNGLKFSDFIIPMVLSNVEGNVSLQKNISMINREITYLS